MGETHVLTALVRKHRELGGKLAACETEAGAIRGNLAHVEATIRLFEEDYDTASIQPKRPHKRSPLCEGRSISRTAIDILRASREPMTARELMLAMLQKRGVTGTDTDRFHRMRNSLMGALRRKERDGVLKAEGKPVRWEVVG